MASNPVKRDSGYFDLPLNHEWESAKDFFVNLYEVRDRATGEVKWTATTFESGRPDSHRRTSTEQRFRSVSEWWKIPREKTLVGGRFGRIVRG